MADSSFDPLALVKAMGPQRDPYSWAELYAQDAAKGQQLLLEMRNRLLAQEHQQKFQAREHEKDRGSRMGIVEYQQQQMNKRAKERNDQLAISRANRTRDFDWPEDSMSVKEAETAGIMQAGKFDRTKYKLATRHGITMLVPRGAVVPPSSYPELTITPAPAVRPDDPYDGY